jgi:hypothetical protein
MFANRPSIEEMNGLDLRVKVSSACMYYLLISKHRQSLRHSTFIIVIISLWKPRYKGRFTNARHVTSDGSTVRGAQIVTNRAAPMAR